MRLHRLRITAFGPFADTVEVDFDDLGSAGLFLLTGATGAGKTSILDAVCFGLYGEVPGDRQQARHLRCDNAGPTDAPRVELEASIAGRTFRFVRSPAWDRPKKRGSGTTPEPAHVLVEERVGEEWVGLTTRLDDAGLLVGDLLGMTCTQFTQVALLPQGRFQAFLRATSAERHAVLQRLFRTDRFERVERWLVEHRLALRRQTQVVQERVAGLVHRIQEAAEADIPAGWDPHDLAGPAAAGEVDSWAAGLITAAAADRDRAAAALVETDAAAAQARTRHDHARRLAELQHRATRAKLRLDELAATEAHGHRLADAVDAHHRAAPVLALAERAAVADRSITRARSETDAARLAAGLPDDVTTTSVEALRLAAVRAQAAAERCRPRQEALEAARDQHVLAVAAARSSRQSLEEASARAAALPARRAEVVAELGAAAAEAAVLAGLEVEAERAAAGHAAGCSLATLEEDVRAGRQALVAATGDAQALRDRYQDAREERIAAMAGELAGTLASGCACPVCGSASHPAPAVSQAAGGREAEDAARRAYEDADIARLALAETLASLEARRDALAEAAGDDAAETWHDRVHAAAAAVTRARDAAARADTLTAGLADLDTQATVSATRLADARVTAAGAEAALDQSSTAVATLDAELAEALTGFGCVDELLRHHEREVATLTAAGRALGSLDEALRAGTEADQAAAQACAEAGFGCLDEVRRAAMPAVEVRAAEQALADRVRAEAAAVAVLAEPGAPEALDQERPDLPALEADMATAIDERRRAEVAGAAAERRSARLERLCQDLDEELVAWTPAREAAQVADDLAAFVEGKGVDNPLRMRLSAYVLGERLRQVVDAANGRLAGMSDQRFSLEHTDERGVGAQRGGLSLLVRDDWSGVLRDPATLSGGETFVVSLALALGLADTVSHEAGGTDVDTLFIDEGFGTLDADTLEDVMDTLDSLREGGRVVGVVSHVTELRERITSQLEVRKGRSGSTLQCT